MPVTSTALEAEAGRWGVQSESGTHKGSPALKKKVQGRNKYINKEISRLETKRCLVLRLEHAGNLDDKNLSFPELVSLAYLFHDGF